MTAVRAQPYPWSEERARKIAKAVAKRKLPMFSAWPGEIDVEDLQSIAFTAIWKAHLSFNPDHILPSGKRVKYATFAYNVAARRILDLWRSRGRKADGEAEYRDFRESEPALYKPDNRDATDLEGLLLVDWLRQVYMRAQPVSSP